jgi:hypothetical protein
MTLTLRNKLEAEARRKAGPLASAPTKNGYTGGPLTPEQRRLCEENLKRLRAFQAEKLLSELDTPSLLDTPATENAAESTHALPEHAQRPISRERNSFNRVA